MPPISVELPTFVAASTRIVRDRQGVRLRPENAAGAYDSSAALVKEFCTFAKIAGSEIAELWGLGVDADVPKGTILEFQLSEDDGVTWRHWDVAWIAAGAEDWSDVAEVRKNIGTFPLGGGPDRSIRVRMRLRPDATTRLTPVVRDLWLVAELEHDPIDDALRSMHVLLSAVRTRTFCREDSAGTDKVTLSDFGLTVDPAAGILVYDVTNDPGRRTNLFQAYDSATRIVTMTAAQAAGRVLEIRFAGGVPVHLVTEAFTHQSQLPIMELEVRVGPDGDQSGGVEMEGNQETNVVRTRMGPRYRTVECVVICVDKDQQRALRMAGAVRDAFEDQGFVRSLATGRRIPISQAEPLAPGVSLSDGVHTPRVGCTLWVREDARAFTQSVAVREISVVATGEESANVRLLSSPLRPWHDEVVKIT